MFKDFSIEATSITIYMELSFVFKGMQVLLI